MPAAKPGRQEVMNAGPHHAKIKVTANVTSAVYVAGSEISGKIDVECRTEKGLGLGTIMVELMAFQELNSRDHAATSTFIHTRRVFQGPGLPPSNAVLPEDEKGRFPPHHFPARRGITTFFFRFPLPLTSPASVDFGSGLAKIRYEVRASASVAWKGEMRLVTDSQEVQVVESAMQEVESAGTVVGESGKIWVQGKVLGGAVIAGQTCCIELHVKNHSSRKTTGVNVTLQRMLHLDNPPPEHANLILSDTLVTAAFHSAEYCCPPGLEGVAKLVINVPRTARTVKGGSRESGEADVDKTIPALFDIRGAVNVRLCMGVGAKDLILNLPVVISHPAALAPEAQNLGLPNQDPAQMRASSPHSLYDPPRSPFPPSQSPVLAQPTGYSSYPVAASPTLPYTQLYFPPPSPQLPHILSQFPAPPISPGLPMSPVLLMSPGHAMSPVLPMSPVHPMSPAPPMVPGPPMSPGPSMSPMLPYPHTTSPVHAYHNQPPFQQPQVYSPPRSPVHPGTPASPQSPRRALPQPPQRRPQSKPKGLAPNPPPLPPRPTSAEPHVHEVGVDLPPSGETPLSPSAGRIQAATEVPDPVEGKGTRALRISEHLKMSSRTRSMSPTGRRFPGPQTRPAPIEPPPPEVVAEVEPAVLSPRPVHTALTEVMDRVGSADSSVTKARVQGLERMVAEDEAEKASIREAKEVRCVDRKSPERSPRKSEQLSQPPPGPRGGRENRSPGRALPRPPSRAGNASQNAPPMPQVESSNKPPTSPKKLPHSVSAPAVASKIGQPPAPVVKPLQPVSTGLTALERRLTIRPEQPPLPPTSPTRKPVKQPEQSASPSKEEPTIDWGEIARVGKLKSFAAAHKKPTIPAFAVPELPPASFVKPQPTIVRKPVPSMDEDEDLPILSHHRTPASSHPPSPRNAPTPIAEARPLMRYELMDNPMPKAVTESSTPISLASAAQSPVLPPSRPSAQLPSQSTAQPVGFPIAPRQPQEIHREVPSSPSRPKPGPRPTSFQTSVPVHISSPSPHPPSPQATTSPMTESKPLVRYELSDSPVPKVLSQPGTPISVTSAIQLSSQPPTQSARIPAQRASVPIPPRPSHDQFSQPTPTPPQSRPTSRPASVVVTSSPATEHKPLVRYELTDNPMPKASPRPKVPEPLPAPVRTPAQAPARPKPQVAPWPPPASRPQPAAPPQQTQTQGGSRHTAFKVTSSPVIETQPLGPSDLAYEPISFTRIEPHALDATKNIPQSPIREPTNLANVNQPCENVAPPRASPTRPKPESRSQSWAPAAKPAVPDHVPRYQLSDGPVSKAPVRYQLDDPPVSEPPITSPAVRASGPEAILTNHRANLRPVSSAKPPPQPRARPRTPPSPIPAASIPLPQSPTKVAVPSRPVAASRPPPPPFPRLEDRAVNAVLPPSSQTTSPKRREPSPRRPRPQDPPAQPTVPVEGDVFGSEQRISPNPQRGGAESQAAQKAKYFESLSTAKRNSPPEKLQPAPQNVRQILQPHQANTSQPSMGTRYAQVQIQPPPSQPQPRSPPRMAPIRTAPSGLEISAPRPIPSPRAVQASPILNYDMPLRSPSPVFTANPVPPTLPTARSLIPITSSGFEVPVVLPGRDARERADAALREAELFRLKREAITRVPMWLGNEYTPQAPPPTRAVRSFTTMELPPQSYWDIQQPGYEEPSMAELLSRESTPVSRAAYDPQLRHPRPRPVSSKPPPALLPSDKELMDKHNIQQSARGGRGGQVTAVTSIWENGKSGPVPTPASERKPQAKRFTAPVGMFGITAKGVLSNEGTSAGMIKSTSVPAMVHTSQAVPVLSSTASLARPIGGPSARTRMIPFAPSIPESQSDDALIRKASQSSDNIPVGQARLKELIGKYQS